eukprot:42659_1
MISAISTFSIFSIMAFKVISQMDFYQMSIQMPIDIDHLNPYQHIHPIKPNTNLLNAHLQQLYSTCTQKSPKKAQKFNPCKYRTIQLLLDLIYCMMWLLI